MAWSLDLLRPRSRCSTGFIGGEALSLCLSSALVDESDRLIWWERVELGQVAAITCRLLVQILDPCGDRIWTAVLKYPFVQGRALSRLTDGGLAGDLMGLHSFRTRFDDLRRVVSPTPGDCFGPLGEAILTVRNALPPAVHDPLCRLTAGVYVFRGAGCRALSETGCVRFRAVCCVCSLLRGQELGTVRRCFLGKRLHSTREKCGNLRIGGCRHPALSLCIGLGDPLDDAVALCVHDGHRPVRDKTYDSFAGAFGGLFQAAVGAVSDECFNELLLRVVEVGGNDVQGVRLTAAGHTDVDASGVERVGEHRV